MAEIIDLTVSPQPDIIEISSEQENTSGRYNRTGQNKKRKRKKGNTYNGLPSDGVNSSARPSRAHSQETGNKTSELNESISQPRPASNPWRTSPSTTGEPGFFCIDSAAVRIPVDDSPPLLEPVESNGDGTNLLLPSHVMILHDNGPTPAEVIPPPRPSSDDEEYIEYLDYEDRKAPGLIRYFEAEGEESNHSRPSISKCKNCGAEGDHKTYDCPVQICLTCGACDEHSTRSCPISKTCYACGMKGHISKTCPNRFSAYNASLDFHGDCDRCGSTEHNVNECPTLWRIYQYVDDDERLLIMQNREQKQRLRIGEGGEGYIGRDMWCYHCANPGHLGDDCNELPHSATFPTEYSAFSSYNIMSGPFYDPVTESASIKSGQQKRDGPRFPDDLDTDVPVDVGKRGKRKDKERLEKRIREQEDEGEDWFNNMKNRGMSRQTSPPMPRGRRLKFGSFKDGGRERSSPPASLSTGGSGLSLLARLGDTPGGRNRPHQSDNSIRIRGAATKPRNWQESRSADARKTDRVRQKSDKPESHRGSKQDHGPRYRGGYER